MHARRIAWIALAAVASFEAAIAQTSDKVDFARDVQPILRQHCIGCHGGALHQAGLRLDRRSDAMRGGTTTPGVIHPGDGRSSVLYIKISSSQFGPQMPPAGPLRPDQIDIIKRWIDDGAEWVCVAEISMWSIGIPVRFEASVLAASKSSRGSMQLSTTTIAIRMEPSSKTNARAYRGSTS
jgi:mono/diheme cytochrome c family protein